MDIEVVDLHIRPSKVRVAVVLVRYGSLLIKCDLVYFNLDKKAWIRMPEKWVDGERKRYCYWPSREISDEFQEKVLAQIFEKFDISLEQISILYRQPKFPRENT